MHVDTLECNILVDISFRCKCKQTQKNRKKTQKQLKLLTVSLNVGILDVGPDNKVSILSNTKRRF